MNYFLDLFSPETYQAFSESDRSISGFRERQQHAAKKVKPCDILVCYMTGLSRWFGLLEVVDGPFIDRTPRFYQTEDPFIVRFQIRAVVWLPVEQGIPIQADTVWNNLSFTREHTRGVRGWTGKLRKSLVPLGEADGNLIESRLRKQAENPTIYPMDEVDRERLTTHKVRRNDKDITVTIPLDEAETADDKAHVGTRESIRVQALLADIGSKMGMEIWIPKADRAAVLSELENGSLTLPNHLPIKYDDTTLKTIEQIDVLWMKGRSIRRAFEVEHTTSVYSGILRMADLLALQPNMDIKLHIVAPDGRREKVFQELRRPVFSILERGRLANYCSYISYDQIRALAEQKLLSHLNETVIDEFEEFAEE